MFVHCIFPRAFDAADLDSSGMVNKEELAAVIKNHLHIQLQDPVNDIDIIFGTPVSGRRGIMLCNADSLAWHGIIRVVTCPYAHTQHPRTCRLVGRG
jgi:hypothetical protein